MLSRLPADFSTVSANHHLPEEPIRSKGQATLLPEGRPELPATIRDISASGIGVLARGGLPPGTAVDIHIHGHSASGTVEDCRPEGGEFYINIALAA
jgi:hypothetical protein